MKHYTTIEQSKKLLALGLNPESADMTWILVPKIDDMGYIYNSVPTAIPYSQYTAKDNYLPCWSLGALLEVLPDRIWSPCDDLDVGPAAHELVFNACGRILQYKGITVNDYRLSGAWFTQETDNLIDVFYNMVVYLLENNYIKKGE